MLTEIVVRALSAKNWSYPAFHDYLKPLDMIVGEAKLSHLGPLEMKSEVSDPSRGIIVPQTVVFRKFLVGVQC